MGESPHLRHRRHGLHIVRDDFFIAFYRWISKELNNPLATIFLYSVICWLYYNHSLITSGLRKISFSFSINGFTSPRSKARWSNAIVRGITLPATTFPFSSTTGFFWIEPIAIAHVCGGIISWSVQAPVQSRQFEPRFETVIVPCSISCFVSLSVSGI